MYDPSEALLQLGLYDYVWGNPALLQTYNANVQAAKARKEQQDYNVLWKNIELAKMQKEQAEREASEQRQRDAEKAALYKQYNEAEGAAERAVIAKRIAAIDGKQESKVKDEMLAAYDKDKLAREYAAEDEAWRKEQALKETAKISELKDLAKKKATKEAIARSVYNKELYPDMNDDERNKLYADIMGVKTIGEMTSDAVNQAVASHAGKKTGENLEEADISKKADEAIRNNTPPSEINDEKVIIAIGKKGRTWKADIKQWKTKGAK